MEHFFFNLVIFIKKILLYFPVFVYLKFTGHWQEQVLKAFGTPLRAVKPREVAADREAREGLQIADKTVCGLGVHVLVMHLRFPPSLSY